MNVEKKKGIVILSGIAALVMFAVCGLAFLNFRTTLFVTLQVCHAEHVSKDDYLEFRLFEGSETRKSFKEELETTIRKDIALEKWLTEEPLVRDMLKSDESIQKGVTSLLTFAGDCEDRTYEGLTEASRQISFAGTFEELCREHSFDTGEMASYLAALYAEDVFYLQDTASGVDQAMEVLEGLKDADLKSDEKVYELKLTTYDPRELCAEPDGYESAYMEACREKLGTDSEYEYVVRKTLTASGDDSFCVTVVAAANTETYKILGLDVSVPYGTEDYIPGFSLNIDGSSSIDTDGVLETIRLDSAALREATDPYAALFDSLFDPLTDDAALKELYHFFYADKEPAEGEADPEMDTENPSAEDAGSDDSGTQENESEEGQIPEDRSEETAAYDDLSLVQQINALEEKIENEYPVEQDWGLLNIFSMYEYSVKMLCSTYVDYQYLIENFDELFAEAQDKETMQEELSANKARFETLRDFIRDSGDLAFAEVSNIQEWKLSEEEFQAQYGDYLHKWYPDAELPKFLYVADVRYSSPVSEGKETFYSLQFTVAVTDSGMRIIGVSTEFNEALEGTLDTYTNNNLWQEPNYILMKSLAEESVNREDYTSEEDYDLAVAQWLYAHYPEYYNNPNGQQTASTHSYTASGYNNGELGSMWNNIKEGISNGANDILDWVTHADERVGEWELDMMGYLDTIWSDMEHGNYGAVPYFITYGTDTAIEIGNEIKEAATDAWNDVKDWFGGFGR